MHPGGGVEGFMISLPQLLPYSKVRETRDRVLFVQKGLCLLTRQKLSLMLAAASSVGLSLDKQEIKCRSIMG